MKVGIAGFGTIGRVIGKALDDGIEGFTLTAVAAGNADKARNNMRGLKNPVPVLSAVELAEQVDVVVECAPTEAFMEVAEPALRAGRTLLTVSAAALLDHPEVIEIAKANNAQIVLATGALLGLDAVRAAAESQIHSVKMVTRKPPRSLAKAKYIVDNGIEISDLKEALKVFEGTAREGAEKFPANVNVAGSLGLAGVGADKTYLEIWADPSKTYNTHTISVEADSAKFEMTIENVPTEENPGTGKITALSVIAALRSLVAPLRVGS